MNPADKQIIVWGAGRIGRGFVADLFAAAGRLVHFVDAERELVALLRERGAYTVKRIRGEGDADESTVSGYTAHHVSEREAVLSLLDSCGLAAVAVFPSAFGRVADDLAEGIERRVAGGGNKPLDILVCANAPGAAQTLRGLLAERLSDAGRTYLAEQVGLAEALIMRIAGEPGAEQMEADPLVVVTNGYPEMPVDATAFRGRVPSVPGVVPTERIEAEEARKLYTYNMLHAVYGYVGRRAGCGSVLECTRDAGVQSVALGALAESTAGLTAEFGFSEDEMREWNARVVANVSNPVLQDTTARLGADPVRKLRRADRLAGPALLCRRHGILPLYLAKAVACALLFDAPGDGGADELRRYVGEHGAREAVVHFCGLAREPELVQLVVEQYEKAGQECLGDEEAGRVALIKEAYRLGFQSERRHRGCAQCALQALFEVTGTSDAALFESASGLSGGTALCGDGSCGAYTGGVLMMGRLVGRRLDHLAEGDKERQYRSYGMAQKLHDRFVATYGGVACEEVHEVVFGRWYPLRTPEEREEFEAAGAHADKCTSVVGTACAWVAEILLDEGLVALRG
jgi:mannitol-1-phosphate 5-dehydrogenase